MLCLEKMDLLQVGLVCVGIWGSLVQDAISVNNMTGCGNNGEYREKQPFADVFRNSCSYKFRNIHSKTPVLESLFNKIVGLNVTILKKDSKVAPTQVFSCEYY